MDVNVTKRSRRIVEGDMPFFKENEQDEYGCFLNDLAEVLSKPAGKKVILTLLKECDIYSISKSYNNQMDAFKNGMKNIGLQLLCAIMHVDNGSSYTEIVKAYWEQYNRRN